KTFAVERVWDNPMMFTESARPCRVAQPHATGALTMVLTEAQVAAYQRDGFVIVENFFSANEVRAMVSELERFKREGLIRNVATDGDGKTHTDRIMNLQVIPLNSKSDLF